MIKMIVSQDTKQCPFRKRCVIGLSCKKCKSMGNSGVMYSDNKRKGDLLVHCTHEGMNTLLHQTLGVLGNVPPFKGWVNDTIKKYTGQCGIMVEDKNAKD